MAQTETARPQYPPLEGQANSGSYYGQQESPRGPPPRDERGQYPTEPPRHGQYPPDPRASAPYPPPGQWPGQQHSAYPPPHPHHYPDPQHGGYPYPPRGDMTQPPQPLQPDAYRLPPPYPPQHGYPYGYPPPAQAPAPAPRQRTAIACKYCRKRKIRCSGYDSSPDGRCQNCVRFNQQCLFHPVSSQAAFVPANAVYGPNARAPVAGPGDRPGENGAYPRPGEQPPMLYGAHGQPLGPAPPAGQPQYPYPPHHQQGYPPYPYPPHAQYPPGPPYEQPGQAPPQDDRVSLKRPPPDDDPHNENSHNSQSPHPNAKPRHSTYDSRANSNGSYSYTEPSSLAPTSPATSVMSHQSYPAQPYTNGNHPQKGNVSPPTGLTPSSAHSTHSYHSPLHGPVRDDGKTPPPNQPGSAGSSVNGRNGMKVHEMLGNHHPEQRGKNDNDMLSKFDRKK